MEQNITLQIDNHIVEVAKGTTILEAARGVGIQIPSLCYMNLEDMCITNLPASCRICVVEVEGRRNLAPACATRCENGMKVKTSSLRLFHSSRLSID